MTINPTAIWRVRPSGSNANGGGYDPGIASPGTDYSQQNAAHVTFNGTTITATTAGVGATITITGYTPAATDVANAVQISGGTNFIVGFYYIVSTGVGTWTLDRNCTTGAGSAMTGAMGGGWADFWTNTTANIVPGNTVYILGSGTPNPSSYTYDYSPSIFTPVSGDNSTGGLITFANDPETPSYKAAPDTTGGMPTIRTPASNPIFFAGNYLKFSGLYFVYRDAGNGQGCIQACTYSTMYGCVCDQFGFDNRFCSLSNYRIIGCEVFSSVAPGGPGTLAAIYGNPLIAIGCNVHDTVGPGMFGYNAVILSNIISKCRGYGINERDSAAPYVIANNTVDANTGSGIVIEAQFTLNMIPVYNNIISNHTTGGTYGLTIEAGTQAQNDLVKAFVDYNIFYNNSTNYNAISAGPHDTQLAVDPYTAQSTEDYKLA